MYDVWVNGSDAMKLVRQAPFTAKQPPERLSPLYRVEVLLATKLPTPCMEKMDPGVEVPTPRNPAEE